MNNRICISIPIISEKLRVNLKVIKKALKADPDFIELRFDYLTDLTTINQHFLIPLVELTKSYCLCIFTFRSFKEGGKSEIEELMRLEILKELIKAKPDYLDIEMETEEFILSQIISLAIDEKVNFLFSHHDFHKTSPLNEAQSRINLFIHKLKDKFKIDMNLIEIWIYKLIFTAETFNDNLIPLNLCDKLCDKYNIVSFCMGKKGTFSRIFCTKFGSFLSYASLATETAPGQLKIEKIRKYHKLFFNS
ncbi:MAG: type I 3-dehydroquinate dehydratase [Promethearchaeota archaeon]|nr:MAG: type I 3-dehydroquinate dehydratase [Candidatus Lokiarchaeota archaeon]